MPKIKDTSKYKNRKTLVDGIYFDSKKEAEHYLILKSLEKNGMIKDLEIQKEFELIPKYHNGEKNIRKTVYRADFVYKNKNDELIVVDIKGYRTEIYKLKKKLFEYNYKMRITEL